MKLVPGIKRGDEYLHGQGQRRLELRRFIYEKDKTFMHWVDTESHIGTHVECPSHHLETGKDVTQLPLETFLGEAVLVRLLEKKAGEPIVSDDLVRAGVKRNDIVLLTSPYKGEERPYVEPKAARWLFETGVKMVGVDDSVMIEEKGSMASHDFILSNDIPIIEGLAHLNELQKDRFFFIGLPIRIVGLDSSWIRAIALEELV